ncbi:uncharacterized protein LOC134684189 isoform X2 [Mytilus trossulus]|uniref:uncharacterized protein LOC134684189 isoform X2 n=1 Tax=Mytilus trossulus TaxID=6551 RepID=UPI0030052FA0
MLTLKWQYLQIYNFQIPVFRQLKNNFTNLQETLASSAAIYKLLLKATLDNMLAGKTREDNGKHLFVINSLIVSQPCFNKGIKLKMKILFLKCQFID